MVGGGGVGDVGEPRVIAGWGVVPSGDARAEARPVQVGGGCASEAPCDELDAS